MNTHFDKTQETQEQQAQINAFPQSKGTEESTFQFVDNSLEAMELRELQEMADNSPQAKEAAQLQEMADNSPQAKEAAQLQAMANNHAAQQQQPIQKKENKTGLPDNLKSGIESLSGYSMDDVKAHRNSNKPAQLQAHAYAQGSDIHLGPGQEQHLPHEAWHVAQQKQGRVKPTMQMKGNINDDAGLEKEADVMGAKALQQNTTVQTKQASELDNSSTNQSTKQLMVAVAGGLKTFNKKDFTQLNHLNWAMGISGGSLVGLDKSIAKIGVNEDLHLVQHGDQGKMVHQIKDSDQWGDVSAQQIAKLFVEYLPQDYAGRIRVSSCYSGTLTDVSNADSSLVGQVKALINTSKRKDLSKVMIVGWDGPTITNINLESDSGTGAETVDNAKVKKAGGLQNRLLDGKYKQLKSEWEKKMDEDTTPLDKLAEIAALEFKDFYQEFTNLCKKHGYLLDYVDSLVIK